MRYGFYKTNRRPTAPPEGREKLGGRGGARGVAAGVIADQGGVTLEKKEK